MKANLTYKPRWRHSAGIGYRNLIAPTTFDDSVPGGAYKVPVASTVSTTKVAEAPATSTLDDVLNQVSGYVKDLANLMSSDTYVVNETPVAVTPVIGTTPPPQAALLADTTDIQNTGEPQAQVQYIDADEFVAISNEGIIIPENANVVIIPVSQYEQPELYQQIVEAKQSEPLKPIEDIVYNVVLNNQSPVSDIVKEEILFTQEVIITKQEYPEASISQIKDAIINDQPVPVVKIDPALNNIPAQPEIVTAADKLNALSDGSSLFASFEKTLAPVTGALGIDDEEQMYVAGSVAVIGVLLLL